MIDVSWLCALAIRSVYWLVLLACNFLGWSTLWARRELKQREREENVRHPLKTPSHVAILVNGRVIDKVSLMSLLDTCLGASIRRLTIYDPVADHSKFAEDLSLFCKSRRIKIISGCTKAPSNIANHRLLVQFLTGNSGKAALVETCRNLSSSPSPIALADITNHLATKFSLSEPELLIQVGNIPCLSGYPPWCLRATEIVPVRALPCSRYAFEECLEAFSKRDIRLGK